MRGVFAGVLKFCAATGSHVDERLFPGLIASSENDSRQLGSQVGVLRSILLDDVGRCGNLDAGLGHIAVFGLDRASPDVDIVNCLRSHATFLAKAIQNDKRDSRS